MAEQPKTPTEIALSNQGLVLSEMMKEIREIKTLVKQLLGPEPPKPQK